MVFHLFAVPTTANAEEHPAIGNKIETRHFLGQGDGIALDHQTNTGAEQKPFGGGRHRSEGHKRVEGIGILSGQFPTAGKGAEPAGRDMGVLGKKERFEPEIFHGFTEFDRVDRVAGWKHKHAEFHETSLSV